MKNENKELFDIEKQIKDVEAGMNGMIIPLLKDTIQDSNKHNNKLFILAAVELVIILVTVITSIFLIYRQNIKYQEFLNQFDFESGYTYTQDIDAGDGSSPVINDGIRVNE